MTRDSDRLDQAARAAWLSWVGGMTQDEIAREMGISRQGAQRLTAQAMAAGIVKVRIDHPLADCLDLGAKLRERFGLRRADVAPALTGQAGVAMLIAELIESLLSREAPMTLAIGNGRTLRSGVLQMSHLDCPQHNIVSLTGNIAPDGSAAYYNVLFSLSEIVTASSFPLMVPVIAASSEERDALHRQPGNTRVMALAAAAEAAIVGIGDLGPNAPLMADGFLSPDEVAALSEAGGVGEILGHAFDAHGRLLPRDVRVASARMPDPEGRLIVAAVQGAHKRAATLGALRGGLVNGLITDEPMARWLLDQPETAA
ncbi:sugar-binding transcriptional regulator [Paracoccus sediminicola]|uniref:sugar-binding transcriptional regulator n=1 Tax=Paracoccus sediminicola TaxID=3017783 RepID=UPI0022F053BE|nr:sugar-binding domain-containing protein [Paracoccus sediminicola]WBU56814.1 sugar-binding transcriptional regulator [Paracoccus sediminicola]